MKERCFFVLIALLSLSITACASTPTPSPTARQRSTEALPPAQANALKIIADKEKLRLGEQTVLTVQNHPLDVGCKFKWTADSGSIAQTSVSVPSVTYTAPTGPIGAKSVLGWNTVRVSIFDAADKNTGAAEVKLFIQININEANEKQLSMLVNIATERAKDIIAYREKYGPFKSISDIINVKGIGEKIFAANEAFMTVD